MLIADVLDAQEAALNCPTEQRFGLPSLTNRDGQADPMLEMFDFTNPTFASPPVLPTATVDQTKLAACP